jgi:hypothetical protein
VTGSDTPFRDHGDRRYFSREGYRGILTRAKGLGYRTTTFRDFDAAAGGPTLLLRHDLDHDLDSALVLAGIESAEGVAATYFIQVACDFYNLLAPAGRAAVRTLAETGHEIGLHYVAGRYVGPDAESNLAADVRLLEDLSGQQVVSAAQHIPIDGGMVDLSSRIRNEAYDPRFTQGAMTYISDSLMAWREATPHDLLDAGRSFQLLTHPECWVGGRPRMPEVFADLEAAELAAVRARFAGTLDHYATLLRERAERDRRFRESRGKAD